MPFVQHPEIRITKPPQQAEIVFLMHIDPRCCLRRFQRRKAILDPKVCKRFRLRRETHRWKSKTQGFHIVPTTSPNMKLIEIYNTQN